MIKLSIIIPVYNTEKYIWQCLQSVINQDVPLKDYEILVVDDGSNDGSLSIMRTFQKEYENIKVFCQNHSGQSTARNLALSHAEGDYVWFIDSDDFIEENCLSEILKALFDNDLDGLRVNFARYDGRILSVNRNPVVNDVISGLDCLRNRKLFRAETCFTLYRKKVIDENKLRFPEGKFSEDRFFSSIAYYFIQRMMFLNRCVYYYRSNPQSTTQNPSYTFKRCIDVLDVAKMMMDLIKKKNDEELYGLYCDYVAESVHNALNNALQLDMESQTLFVDNFKQRRYLWEYYKGSSRFVLKLEGFLLRYSFNSLKTYKCLKLFWKGLRFLKLH